MDGRQSCAEPGHVPLAVGAEAKGDGPVRAEPTHAFPIRRAGAAIPVPRPLMRPVGAGGSSARRAAVPSRHRGRRRMPGWDGCTAIRIRTPLPDRPAPMPLRYARQRQGNVPSTPAGRCADRDGRLTARGGAAGTARRDGPALSCRGVGLRVPAPAHATTRVRGVDRPSPGGAQALATVGDRQLHAAQAAVGKVAEDLGPEHAGFGLAGMDARDCAPVVRPVPRTVG